MSEKQPNVKKAKENEEVNEEKTEVKPFQFGVAPSLIINIVRENRVYRFEMPIGSKLSECKEACLECVEVVNKMIAEAERKQAEESLKKETEEKSESNDEEMKKEE